MRTRWGQRWVAAAGAGSVPPDTKAGELADEFHLDHDDRTLFPSEEAAAKGQTSTVRVDSADRTFCCVP